MHTSKVLKSSDFQYWRLDIDKPVKVEFNAFCPNYHELDRVGVVSPQLEDGLLYTGYALLALTTAFYDVLRSRLTDFFDYPQHFAFIDVNREGVCTRGGRLPLDKQAMGAPWGGLDVWPDSNWITTSGDVMGVMKKVFDFQINRLFWPQDFKPSQDEVLLPAYVRDMLRARLKAVYYYRSTSPNLEIRVSQPVEDIVQKSIARVPKVEGTTPGQIQPNRATQSGEDKFAYIERYQQVNVTDFLEDRGQWL
jgi:hypothetical protein